MKKIILILLIIFPLTSCSKKENSGIKNENFSNTLRDVEYITKKYVNYDKDAKANMLSIIDNDEYFQARIKTNKEKELKSYIKEKSSGNKKLKWIYDNFDKLNYGEKVLVGNDDDACDYVYNCHNNKKDFNFFDGQSLNLHRKTPYYLQWDNRWAYDNLIGDDNIGIAGCGPTSMAMVLSRLFDDEKINPKLIAQDAKNHMTEDGVYWSFFEFEAKKYKVKIEDIDNTEKDLKNALKKGPIVVSVKQGYFTTGGHIMVIDSMKDDKLLINDPNSIKNSKIEWPYKDIQDQFVKLWLMYK
ncbi:C39 family peptidase [Anaerococcus ihuae]|uniref:C39 family peptidase n=1 Tax=Anaerococcus ihuae TaxID=2899519 RepID=UPI001F3ECBC3|nr:C39 family peptidase [Anaerococcus ihuae]